MSKPTIERLESWFREPEQAYLSPRRILEAFIGARLVRWVFGPERKQ